MIGSRDSEELAGLEFQGWRVEDRPVRARGCRALLVSSLLLLSACATGRLADLPDRPAVAVRTPSDDETRQREIDSLRDAFAQRDEVSPGRQPVAPTFVPKATRIETMRAMLSMSNMGTRPYGLEEVYKLLDPTVRALSRIFPRLFGAQHVLIAQLRNGP